MAGIFIPTVFLLVILSVLVWFHFYLEVPTQFAFDIPMRPLERAIVFPMAVVPNLWGLWNILFLAWHERLHLSLGLHGALLPFLLGPLGLIAASILSFQIPAFATHVFPFAAPVGLIIYYLAWKYLVGFLNGELGIG